MNVSQLAVYKLPDVSISKRRGANMQNSNVAVKASSHRPGDTAQFEMTDRPSVLEKRWLCKSTPTMTITVHVRASTCAVIQTLSIAPPSPPPLASAPPAPPVPAPAIPLPPPPVAPPDVPSQPALTTTVHDTIKICPGNSMPSVSSRVSTLLTNFTSLDTSWPCQSTLETKTSNLTAPLTSTPPCPSDDSGGMMTTQILPMKRNDQEPRGRSSETPSTMPIAQPSSPSDFVKKTALPTWERIAYYTSAAPAAATGFAFLANLGDPQKSGTFD
jgi:hypothetical protein